MTSLEFTSQVQKISSSLRPVAMNLTRDADDAKDLVQETLLKALLNKDKFKAGTNLKAWLYTIMRNTFINNYNKITKRSSNIDSTEYFQYFNTDENYITHNGATTDFVVRDINEAIASLGTDYRTPFMMYYIGYKAQSRTAFTLRAKTSRPLCMCTRPPGPTAPALPSPKKLSRIKLAA